MKDRPLEFHIDDIVYVTPLRTISRIATVELSRRGENVALIGYRLDPSLDILVGPEDLVLVEAGDPRRRMEQLCRSDYAPRAISCPLGAMKAIRRNGVDEFTLTINSDRQEHSFNFSIGIGETIPIEWTAPREKDAA